MMKLLLSFAAGSFQTALKSATGVSGWLNMKMELHLPFVKIDDLGHQQNM
jgi:hypothetical protein